jgi:hypothetical protein
MFALFLVKVLTLQHEKNSLENLISFTKRYVYNIILTEGIEKNPYKMHLLTLIPKLFQGNI